MVEIFYLFNFRYIIASVFNRAEFVGNPYVLIAIGVLVIFQLGFTYLLLLQTLFGTVAIGIDIWLRNCIALPPWYYFWLIYTHSD